MAYYAGEDDFYQDQPDFTDEHMEERLVGALGNHVQDSVNQALINALKPYAQPLRRFGQRELRGHPLLEEGLQPDQLPDLALSQGALKRPLSSADILATMSASVMQGHGYDVYSSLNTSEGNRETPAKPDDLSFSGSLPLQIRIKKTPNHQESANANLITRKSVVPPIATFPLIQKI
ncbi:hypothetical protein NDU88_007743 [Pleurodeles waltl]|uniref:Uncharacterized protein n=1 Tax=Pleurodeles waltl TaxID=8319 RepID=A0AAV7QSR0_PLEWA|nr:hypothetical protein NDU88_007743 [Pleurodeles waltl]